MIKKNFRLVKKYFMFSFIILIAVLCIKSNIGSMVFALDNYVETSTSKNQYYETTTKDQYYEPTTEDQYYETTTEDQDTEKVPQYVKWLGDVDCDGVLSSYDARITLRSSIGLNELSEEKKFLADVTEDGVVAAADARLILRMITCPEEECIDISEKKILVDEKNYSSSGNSRLTMGVYDTENYFIFKCDLEGLEALDISLHAGTDSFEMGKLEFGADAKLLNEYCSSENGLTHMASCNDFVYEDDGEPLPPFYQSTKEIRYSMFFKDCLWSNEKIAKYVPSDVYLDQYFDIAKINYSGEIGEVSGRAIAYFDNGECCRMHVSLSWICDGPVIEGGDIPPETEESTGDFSETTTEYYEETSSEDQYIETTTSEEQETEEGISDSLGGGNSFLSGIRDFFFRIIQFFANLFGIEL